MKIFLTKQIKEIDNYTIREEPIVSIDLMERAASECSDWIAKHFSKDTQIKYFAGPGNNGGDAWAIARILAEKGYENQKFYLVKISNNLSPDSQENKERLVNQGKVDLVEIENVKDFPLINAKDLIVDGLFGSGLTRPVEGIAGELIKHINNSPGVKISIDIPSGLKGEDNTANIPEHILMANYTLSFQFPKLSFFFAENRKYTGDWHVLPIGLHKDIISKTETLYSFVEKKDIRPLIKLREKFSHKGTYGHALLIAGSYGMMGAAVLAAKACIRSGVGLLTAHIPHFGINIMQTSVPESLISIDQSDLMFTEFPDLDKYSAIAIGPAINNKGNTKKALKTLLESVKVPLVLDADALNIMGENKGWIKLIPKNSILTPHPKEFERLVGAFSNSYERLQKQTELSKKYTLFIAVKGAYTSISCPDGKCYFNSTGNPGMATGGSGDVLTGILLSLLAQGYNPKEAVLISIYLHGLAGDIASEQFGEHALIASDIINNIGFAFKTLANGHKK